MSDIDLETLRTEYESARAELNQLRQGLKRAEHAVTAAQSALSQRIVARHPDKFIASPDEPTPDRSAAFIRQA